MLFLTCGIIKLVEIKVSIKFLMKPILLIINILCQI